jgi:hypothetical protein
MHDTDNKINLNMKGDFHMYLWIVVGMFYLTGWAIDLYLRADKDDCSSVNAAAIVSIVWPLTAPIKLTKWMIKNLPKGLAALKKEIKAI